MFTALDFSEPTSERKGEEIAVDPHLQTGKVTHPVTKAVVLVGYLRSRSGSPTPCLSPIFVGFLGLTLKAQEPSTFLLNVSDTPN